MAKANAKKALSDRAILLAVLAFVLLLVWQFWPHEPQDAPSSLTAKTESRSSPPSPLQRRLNLQLQPGGQALLDEIDRMTWQQACVAWGEAERKATYAMRTQALRDHLSAIGALNESDLSHVYGRTLEVGMTECGVYAVAGRPTKINETITAFGRSAQIIFRDTGIYVYTEQPTGRLVGIVTSYQHG